MNEQQDHSQRGHALLSASSAHRWLACPPSAVAAENYPDPDTDFTREGTGVWWSARKATPTISRS